jgi:hypothetical protein
MHRSFVVVGTFFSLVVKRDLFRGVTAATQKPAF